MADLNRWVRTQKRRSLEELRAEVQIFWAASRGDNKGFAVDRGQRRGFKRVLQLIDAKLLALREEDERADSQSADVIDEGLKA